MLLNRTQTHHRRGAILLIVLTLLALFAVIGLSFVLYAESEALAARTRREARATNDEPPSAEVMASAFLGRFVYPSGDTGDALLNSIRGYDMATMVYGNNPAGGNNIPYNGIGTVYEDLSANTTATVTAVTDRRQVVNYSWQFNRTTPANSRVFDPEYLGVRSVSGTAPTTTYVGRNAPYTYPDRNNLYVAVQDPRTGRILRPSFVSSHFGGLASTNANWTSAAGRYMTIRPRPGDQILSATDTTQFPFPPANPDGTYTGDVQNIVYTDGMQQNDAVWINAGLPVVQWRGRNMIAIVAPTILALDGRVNANVAGNTKGTSTNGFGPWEIGLSRITSDADKLLRTRTGSPASPGALATPNPRGTTLATHPFATSPTQSYAGVNWDGSTVATGLTMPMVNQSDPTYPAGFDSSTAANTESNQHPGLLNPYAWNSFTNPGKLFSFTDLRRTSVKYTGKPTDYNLPYFGSGTGYPLTSLNTTGPSASSPANAARARLTTISNSLARPGLMPNFADYGVLTHTGTSLASTASPLTLPLAVGATTDFSSATSLRNNLATLGPVNVNRPLADYRAATNPTGALSATNIGNVASAANDRQTLARDIFARLILATGARATITTTGTITLPQPSTMMPGKYDLITPDDGDTTPEQYNALRFLAQMAANIVDYIDNDDVATTFVWNPDLPSLPAPTPTNINLLTADTTSLLNAANFQTAAIPDRVVYGVEKPRILLNEVYAEVANNQSDKSSPQAASPFDVRFFVELINPTNLGTDATAPLGTNAAALRGLDATNAPVYSAYQIQIFDSAAGGGGAVRNALYATASSFANPAGDIPGTPKLTADFVNVTVPSMTATQADGIEPNNGTLTGTGFRVCGPDGLSSSNATGSEFIPDTSMAPYNNMLQTPKLTYTVPAQKPTDIPNVTLNPLKDHGIVLRRLANPYFPPNTNAAMITAAMPYNPYITVDSITDVDANDAIRVGLKDGADGGRPMTPQLINHKSRGRAVPHYGYRNLTTPANTFTVDQTLVPPMPMTFGQTFYRHNSNFTQAAEWLVHLDRPLINTVELLHIAGVKPHEVTYHFASTDGTTTQYQQHTAFQLAGAAPLYRALELLTTKPWGYGLPAEGRVPGKININMIWDQTVLEALLDRQPANSFDDTTDAMAMPTPRTDHITPLWQRLFIGSATARTIAGNGIPAATVDEGGTDRPFKSLGAATFTANATSLSPAGMGVADTILRQDPTTATPLIFGGYGTHPYQKAEMLRKMYNNITTTSDTYLVVMTVGFFEVRNSEPYSVTNPPVLGKEVFDEIPGDLRKKFVSVVDRSMIARAVNATGADINEQADRLFYTDVADTGTPENLPANTSTTTSITNPVVTLTLHCQFDTNGTTPVLYYEGRKFTIGGTGSDAISNILVGTVARKISITGITATATDTTKATVTISGTAIVTIPPSTPAQLIAPPGTLVSSGLPGNPGFQSNFNVSTPQYKGVVPYFEQVEIGK
jgi:hypothetical protein